MPNSKPPHPGRQERFEIINICAMKITDFRTLVTDAETGK